jgi:hypothetical protein
MIDLLNEERFDFIANDEKRFMSAFDDAMTKLGYTFGNNIGSGYCWGRYMLIYRKSEGKSKNVFARIYIRDENIVLRLFLNAMDKHRGYIENSPSHIKEVFVGDHGKCKHCHNDKAGDCRFRKTYTIDGQLIEKCNGITFEFPNPSIQRLTDYISLFTEFYPNRKR